MLHTTEEYEAIRKEYRELAKKNFTKIGRVLSAVNMWGVLPFTVILPIYGLFADVLRFLWALPLGIIAFFFLSLLNNATKQRVAFEEFGDDVFLKKVLRDDVIVVDPTDIRLLLVEAGTAPVSSASTAEAINRLDQVTRRFEGRPASRMRTRFRR